MNVAQLTIEMAANVARLKTDMAAARNTVEGTMTSIKKAASQASYALGSIGAALSVRELVRTMDAYTKFNAQLKLSTSSAEQYAKAQESVRLIAKEAQSDISAIGVLYSRISNATKELNISQSQVVDVTRSVGLALKVSGATAQESASAMLQLSQAFGSGLLRGEEFNAVNEAAPRIMKALADGMGVPIGQLRKMASEGQITAKIMAEALPLALQDLIKEAQSVQTISGAFQTLKNELLLFVGATGEANNVTGFLAGTLNDLSTIFGVLNAQTSDATGNMQALKMVQDGIATVFETVIALGVNVSYVLSQIGNEIGGIAAQIASVFRTGSLDEARAIREMMVKDAEAARAQVDKTTEAIINSRKNNVASMQMLDHYSKENVKSLMGVAGASEKAAKEAEKLAKAQDKARQAATELVASIAFETETMQMSNLEREIANNLLKLEKTGLQENTDEYRAYAEAIRQATIQNEGIKERIKLEKEAADKRKKIEEDYAKEVEQINFQIGQSLTDALINGGVTAKEFLINMFKTLILRPILQPIIQGGTAMVMSALGMSGTANAGTSLSGVSQLGSLASMASGVKTAYAAVTGGLLAGLDAVAAGAQAATFAIGEGLSAMGMEAAGSAVFGSAGTVGLAAQGMAGVGAGTLAGEWISGGRSLIGGNSLYTTAGGAAAGAAIGTAVLPGIGSAIGGLIGGIVGGLANAAFGSGAKQVTGQNVSGTWTPGGLVGGQQFATWNKKGGWFGGGGSGRDYMGMNAELESYMSNAVINVANASKQYADILGLNAEAINNVTHYFEIPANSVEQLTEYLERELTGYSNKLAEAFLAGTNFGRAGETASETMQRLAGSLTTVNAVFDTLGLKLHETSLAGGNVASAFIEMMGGLEAFNQATDFYYQNFYTQAERTAKTTKNLTDIFGAMNLALPETREQFRVLVETARAAGDDVLLANLLKLAPAFNSLAVSMDQANQAIMQQRTQLLNQIYQMTGDTTAIRSQELSSVSDELNIALQNSIYAMQDAAAAQQAANQAVANATANLQMAVDAEMSRIQETIEGRLQDSLKRLDEQFNNLSDTINAEIAALQNQKSVTNEMLNDIRSIFNFLDDQISDLMGSLRPIEIASEGFAFVAQALQTAQATGYMPDQALLQKAVSAARTGLGAESFASALEMRKANAQFVNNLIQLQDIAANQEVKTEEQVVKQDEQIELLRRRLEQARQQFDADVANSRAFYDAQINSQKQQLQALLGINTATLSVSSAVVALAQAIDASAAANAAMTAAQQQAAAAATAASEASKAPKLTPTQQLITNAYTDILRRPYDVAGMSYWEQSGLSIQKIRESMLASPEYRNLKINDFYREIFNREADASGLAWWASTNLTLDQIRTELLKAKAAGAYADGGFYPGGMALVGEEGPELINFKRPGQVYTASETSAIMSNDGGTAEEVRQLRVENQAQSRAIVMLQSRMTRLLERWDGDGLPEERVVTA